MKGSAAFTKQQPLPADTESPYAPGGEFGAVDEGQEAIEAPAQELVPAGIPRTPLHIHVKNLITREEARETQVRLLHEEVGRLKSELADHQTATALMFEERDRAYAELLARVQDLGDEVDAPQWKPSKGGGS